MSRLEIITCLKCNEQKRVRVADGAVAGNICNACLKKSCDPNEAIAAANKERHLAELAKLPIEERVARIERHLYG